MYDTQIITTHILTNHERQPWISSQPNSAIHIVCLFLYGKSDFESNTCYLDLMDWPILTPCFIILCLYSKHDNIHTNLNHIKIQQLQFQLTNLKFSYDVLPIIKMGNILTIKAIDLFHRCGPLPASHELAGKLWQLCKVLYVFEHKVLYLSIHAPFTRIVVFWHICDIPPMIA